MKVGNKTLVRGGETLLTGDHVDHLLKQSGEVAEKHAEEQKKLSQEKDDRAHTLTEGRAARYSATGHKQVDAYVQAYQAYLKEPKLKEYHVARADIAKSRKELKERRNSPQLRMALRSLDIKQEQLDKRHAEALAVHRPKLNATAKALKDEGLTASEALKMARKE